MNPCRRRLNAAMAFALVGLRTPGVSIAESDVVSKSWPRYWEFLARLHAAGSSAPR